MVKGELILNWLNTLFTSESPHEKHCSSKRSLFGKPTMNDQLIVSAQKFPLSTSRVCHAYSEDNIRKLRSLFQRSLACIVMVPSVDTNGLHGFFFFPIWDNHHCQCLWFQQEKFLSKCSPYFCCVAFNWNIRSEDSFYIKRVPILRSINRWHFIVLIHKVKGLRIFL